MAECRRWFGSFSSGSPMYELGEAESQPSGPRAGVAGSTRPLSSRPWAQWEGLKALHHVCGPQNLMGQVLPSTHSCQAIFQAPMGIWRASSLNPLPHFSRLHLLPSPSLIPPTLLTPVNPNKDLIESLSCSIILPIVAEEAGGAVGWTPAQRSFSPHPPTGPTFSPFQVLLLQMKASPRVKTQPLSRSTWAMRSLVWRGTQSSLSLPGPGSAPHHIQAV